MDKMILLLMLLFPIHILGQNEIRIGDNLKFSELLLSENFSLSDSLEMWDFSDAQLLSHEQNLHFFSNRDSTVKAFIASFDGKTKYLYDERGDGLYLVAFQNKQVRIKYDEAEIDLRYPLCLQDSCKGWFSAHGDDVHGDLVHICGKYKYKIIGKGTLLTIDRDTLPNTLLIHNQRLVSSLFNGKEKELQKYGVLDSIPKLSYNKVDSLMKSDTALVRNDVYRWYAPGYRYPILKLETISSCNGRNRILNSSALYCSVLMQNELSDDSINEEIRRKITKEGKCQKLQQQDRGQNLLKANNYSVNINNTGVNLSYSLLDDANISYGVYTQDGIFLVNRKLGKQKQGKYNMAIDLGYVNKKNLIFTLFVNGIPYSKVIGENVQ